ncbi:MAG: sulfur carrier protein ThiS [Jatrophihabitantaceae bacterium]
MSFELNGDRHDHTPGITLLALIEQHAGSTRGSAVVVDGLVVPRSAWAAYEICNGQRIELITAVQGG